MLTVLSEGMGVNAACRVTGASKNTVLKLLADVGRACAIYQDQAMRKLTIKQVQVDRPAALETHFAGARKTEKSSRTLISYADSGAAFMCKH